MKTYDNLKDSGIKWVGEIPEHWVVKKLKFIGTFTASGIDKKIEPDEPLVQIINYTDVYGNTSHCLVKREYMVVSTTQSKIKEHQVVIGDLLFTPSSETIQDIGVSALVVEEMPNTAYSYHILRFRFQKEIYLKYRKYLCNNHYVLNYFSSLAEGTTRKILGRDEFNNTFVVLPSLQEQIAIATYLDTKTTEIDQTIANKEALINLFEEEKKALINEAVTKGLNPTVKLKQSGVDWLGDIPEHWEVKKLKYLVDKIGSGVTPRGGSDVYELEGIPLLRSQNIYNDGLRLEDVAFITEETHNLMKGSKVKLNDILLNITGASLGRCYYFNGSLKEANVNQHVCIIRVNEKVNFHFLRFCIISDFIEKQIENSYTGSGREGLSNENLNNFYFGIPPLKEQTAIVKFIETETGKITDKINLTKQEIELLKEYRQALIFEAVTGKICVV